jgi:hypothetical protein
MAPFAASVAIFAQRFGISKRTAQRMLRVLEPRFPDTNLANDSDGRRR